tara:strand:+ start:3827 stop:4405 length:579 start_codon:yes stop_codon:yes gene_type:complete
MIRIAILGDIGSGKSHIAKKFGYPIFNADKEVSKIYNKDKKSYKKLKKLLPRHIISFPIKKKFLSKAILANKKNIKKIGKVIHPEVRQRLRKFEKKHKKEKLVVLDIPLFLENKMNRKNDVLIFVSAEKKKIKRSLKMRSNFNPKIVEKLKKLQLPLEFKKKKSNFVIKNNFQNKSAKNSVKNILKKIKRNA